MSPSDGIPSADLSEARLQRLEERLSRLERLIGGPDAAQPAAASLAPMPAALAPVSVAPELESEIGEFWLARVGVVALIVGLAFLVTFPFAGWPAIMPSAIGYAAVAVLLVLSRLWRQALPDTARIVFGGALFLLYFATLRLNFLSANPAVASRGLVLALVAGVLVAQFIVAVRRGSELTAALAVVLVVVTAVVSDAPTLPLVLLLAAAVAAAWLYRAHHWWRLELLTVALVYAAHLNWLVGNPLAGHRIHGVSEPHLNLPILLLSGAVFLGTGLLRPQAGEAMLLRVVRAVLSGGGLLVLGLLNARMFHAGQPPWVQLALAALFLGAATAYWLHHRGRYGTAVYACYGYLAVSAAIVAWFPSPAVFSWLAWQSLLVAATAVWFQSKIIIVANLFIFGGIYVTYLAFARAAGAVNLSFALVALAIARILNWQRQRLDVRTELMRNIYLGAATLIIPYGLYHTVPRSLVSTSWLLAAAGYFVASIVLGSKKYRWMAMATIFATIGYVFVVDLSRLEPAYRILSFLVLGIVLIGFSIFYARQRAKAQDAARAASGET